LLDVTDLAEIGKPTGAAHMRLARGYLAFKAVARSLEAVLRRLLAPSVIVGVLIAFLALTFLVAELLAYLLDQSASGSVLFLWALTTALGVVVVRQLPRALK
jgi:hypothetical protein